MIFMTEGVAEGEPALMKLHENPFAKHIEHPGRLETIEDVAKELKLEWMTDNTKATEEQVKYAHTKEYIDIMATTENLSLKELENFPDRYGFEDIYVNNYTYQASLKAAGCGITLVDTVLKTGKIGFAGLRPPGHHAGPSEASGFCYFNNVAIAAKHIVKTYPEIQRVLIVDWDVHCGQGTQECIAGDDRIKLVNIFRHEHGAFWPYHKRSGIVPLEDKYKNTVNVPLNDVGFGNWDYLTIMHQIVYPVVKDWKPQFILVSCGFDAAFGDPEGDMTVTPLGFAYMTRALSTMRNGDAPIPFALFFEGGYFLPVMKESFRYVSIACNDEKQLPRLANKKLHRDLAATIHRVHEAFREEFPSFDVLFRLVEKFKELPSMEVVDKYIGRQPDVAEKDCCVIRSEDLIAGLNKELEKIVENENPSDDVRYGDNVELRDPKPVSVETHASNNIGIMETDEKIIVQVPDTALESLITSTILLPMNPNFVPPTSDSLPSEAQIALLAEFIESHRNDPAVSHIPIFQMCIAK